MRALFISDLHLLPDDAETNARFDAFLRDIAPGSDTLYILGDLFHVWLGDAMLVNDSYAQQIAQRLQQLSTQGTLIYLARGNRDFMLGTCFAKAAGANLLAAQTLIEWNGRRILLMHGDELCTDDCSYQRLRAILRSRLFFWAANHLPICIRRHLAKIIRQSSQQSKAQKSMAIMDVNASTVETIMQIWRADTLIHGHTHRPAYHVLPANRERWVLTDWQQAQGYLQWQAGHFSVMPYATH